jgi:hypothetical protein
LASYVASFVSGPPANGTDHTPSLSCTSTVSPFGEIAMKPIVFRVCATTRMPLSPSTAT